MTNAMDEFTLHVSGKPRIKCAILRDYDADWMDDCGSEFILKYGFSDSDYNNFISLINFNYDSGYGTQELFGFIWYDDGSWSQRGEYDGSEWWEYMKTPDIPEICKQ